MEKTIKNFVDSKENGLMLLNLPTGFGKTTSVVKFIKSYLEDKNSNIKKIYFVANLKNNLPIEQLQQALGNDYDKYCLILKPYWESVVDNFENVKINAIEITKSDEYNALRQDIETLKMLEEQSEKANNDEIKSEELTKNSQLKSAIDSYKNKIENDSEPKFRKFLKKTYFYNKPSYEKEKILKKEKWISELYSQVRIKDDDIKVVITTTNKFFSPTDIFCRMPFYLYNEDKLTKNTITFIDEFDTTKSVLLNQIISDGLKYEIDIFSLFLDIYNSLTNLNFPNELKKSSKYRVKKIEEGKWDEIEDLIDELKTQFKNLYNTHKLNLLFKSKNLNKKKAFIFNDGYSLNIYNDKSKMILISKFNEDENNMSIMAEKKRIKSYDGIKFDTILYEVNKAINSFIRKVAYMSRNYMEYKNEKNIGQEAKYTFDEATFTILSAFNIPSEFRQYLLEKVIVADVNYKIGNKYDCNDDEKFMRYGFEYTEIKDDHNHDLQTKAHAFRFNTTPEDILIKLCLNSRVVGISATASVDTVIGNYDIDFLKKVLKENYYKIQDNDFQRLKKDFLKTQMIYDEENITINTISLNDSKAYSYKEKCIEIVNKLFKDGYKEKYLEIIDNSNNHYYDLIVFKLLELFKYIAQSDNIYSTLAFLNSFPKNIKQNENAIDFELLNNGIQDLKNQELISNSPIMHIIKSKNYDEKLSEIHSDLADGKKVLVISTYKTIGNGKNIQYKIPNDNNIIKNVICTSNINANSEKDFDAVYLSTPTNLTQVISFNSENKTEDLCRLIFEQEYLYKKGYVNYNQKQKNIETGFKRTFYNETLGFMHLYSKDVNLHTAQLIIQAIGRICRTRNKNKTINIFYDNEIIRRLNSVHDELINENSLYNKEFLKLFDIEVLNANFDIEKYAKINKDCYYTITKMAKELRSNNERINEWKELREYVLKNPTTNLVKDKYKQFYFEFDDERSAYSYRFANNEISEIYFDNYSGYNQVSEDDCGLSRLMQIEEIKDFFVKNHYACTFGKGKYILSQSLYRQIYKAALGEIVGKIIVEIITGFELENINNTKEYELFDYKSGNLYFDFKNWDNFIVDNENYCKKIEYKLKQIKCAEKVVVINLFKKENDIIQVSTNEKIIQIPYLIDENNEINYKEIDEKLQEFL